MRRNAIVATILVLLMSAGIGLFIGGGVNNVTNPRPAASPQAIPATPADTPADLPPFFRIIPSQEQPLL